MTRGRIDSPKLDDRSWQDLVEEAKRLIPKYTPEWTDHGPGDLGITLIELFAWMMEVTLFRLNQVPRKNFIEFLNLLGITRDPATPASVWLRFQTNPAGQPKMLPAHFVCTTHQTEGDQPIRFETERPKKLQPANLVELLRSNATEPPSTTDFTAKLSTGPLEEQEFVIAGSEELILLLGFDQSRPEGTELEIAVSALQPETARRLEIRWSFSTSNPALTTWPDHTGQVRRDETQNLRRAGLIVVSVPAGWQSVKLTEEQRFWIAMKVRNPSSSSLALRWKHLLFNSTLATSVTSIPEGTLPQNDFPGVLVGMSTGEPFQRMELPHRPVYHDPRSANPFDHLEVLVSEPSPNPSTPRSPVRWQLVEDLPEGDGRFFLLDPATGTLQFGDYDSTVSASQSREKRHGRIPPHESEVRVRYRYVSAGEEANVAAHQITTLSPLGELDGLVQAVANPGSAEEGSQEESVEDALQRAPKLLRIRNRAVTLEDYEYLARESATDVYRARALGLSGTGSKNFIMAHPKEPGKQIDYCALEGPEGGAYIRGRAELKDGKAEVSYPDHFAVVVDPETVTIQLTPCSAESKGLAVTGQSATGFQVQELAQGTGNYQFHYFATGVRLEMKNFQPVVDQQDSMAKGSDQASPPAASFRPRSTSGGPSFDPTGPAESAGTSGAPPMEHFESAMPDAGSSIQGEAERSRANPPATPQANTPF